MINCTVKQISKMFGGNLVFEGLSCEIKDGDKIGVVGRNGCGKTTLFQLMAGMEAPDKGEIHRRKGIKIGYLQQIPQFPNEWTVRQVMLQAFTEVSQLGERLRQIEQEMSSALDSKQLDRLLNTYGKLQEQFAELGGYEVDSELTKVANGLQITHLLEQTFQQLSGGEQTKIGLAMILLQQPEVLLLDEPTNHLDITAVEWLEHYLKQYHGSCVIISHDRYFLDQVVSKIFEIEDGELNIYVGNYSSFLKQKDERLLAEFAAYQEQQKKIKKMEAAIKRLRDWANRGDNEMLHKRATNMQRALDRMEKHKKPILEHRKINLQFEMNERSGKDVISLDHVKKSFDGRELFSNLQLAIYFGECCSIVGANGSGKSTLLKMIMNEVEPDEGIVKVGSHVKIGYLSQHINIPGELTVLEAFRDQVRVTEGEARHILAKFLFYGPAVFHQVKSLSGGEKMRLRLAQLMYQELNLLILDEPTNHLDIDSREVLEEALEQFNGTIVAVSHDRYFLNKLFHKTYWLEEGRLIPYAGNYQYAREKRG